MRFTANSKEMAIATSAAARTAAPAATLPILGNLLLQASGGAVRVRATDLSITADLSFKAEVHEAGACTVSAKLLNAYLSNLFEPSIEVTGTDTLVRLVCGKSTSELYALPPEEFPALPDGAVSSRLNVDADALRRAINAVAFAASRDDARGAVLGGVLFEIGEGCLALVATDGYRLARCEVAVDASETTAAFIVPARAAIEIAKTKASGAVQLTALGGQNNHLRFDFTAKLAGEGTIVARLVDGQYPNYRGTIPAAATCNAVLAKSALLSAVKRARVMSEGRGNMLVLSFADDRLCIDAKSDLSGNAHEEMPVRWQGEPLQIMFNAEYLGDVIDRIDAEALVAEFTGELKPAIFKPAGDNKAAQLAVLMPLRK